MIKQTKTERCALIIKNLNSLKNLISNIRLNYSIFISAYEKRAKSNDIQYKQISCLLNNFILTASILKQHIKSYEKDFDDSLLKTIKYNSIKASLFDNEFYLILLGLRNYLQHIFELKLGIGNILSNNEDDLFILGFTMLKHKDLHAKKPENIAVQNYFKQCYALPIELFASENMYLIEEFYKKYDKAVHAHYKSMLNKYNSNDEVDQYAMDMHEIYLNNFYSFNSRGNNG